MNCLSRMPCLIQKQSGRSSFSNSLKGTVDQINWQDGTSMGKPLQIIDPRLWNSHFSRELKFLSDKTEHKANTTQIVIQISVISTLGTYFSFKNLRLLKLYFPYFFYRELTSTLNSFAIVFKIIIQGLLL